MRHKGLIVGLFFLAVLFLLHNCRASRNARETFSCACQQAQAGGLYTDTAALAEAIAFYKYPVVNLLYARHNARLTYYLGRNYEVCGRYEQAANCYIRADKLCSSDPSLQDSVAHAMTRLCDMASETNEPSLLHAAYLIDEYQHDPDRLLAWKVSLTFCIVFCIVMVGMQVYTSKWAQLLLARKTKELQSKNLLLEQRNVQIEDMDEHLAEMQKDRGKELEHNILHLSSIYPRPDKAWRDYNTLRKAVSPQLFNLMGKLEQMHVLSEQEIAFCVYYTLYPEVTLSEIADWLNYSPKGIRNYKQRIAHKLQTTSANLATCLRQLAIAP